MKTVCRVYDNVARARAAVDDLQTAGIAEADISIVASRYVSAEDADVYSEAIRRGGTMVAAQAPDAEVVSVEALLATYRPIDLAARGEDDRQTSRTTGRTTGWQIFDETVPPHRPREAWPGWAYAP